MITPLTITFPLAFFSPEKFGLTRAQAESDPDLFANNVAGSLGQIFQKIGQNARIAIAQSDVDLLVRLGVFNGALMNDAVYKLKHYEVSSLSYSGNDTHEGEDIGLFDTVASIVVAKHFVNVETIKEKNYANS